MGLRTGDSKKCNFIIFYLIKFFFANEKKFQKIKYSKILILK